MQILNVAGGKARLADWIISHFPPHKVYVEPFGGSAAVLLAKERSPLEIYNDIDRELVLFFQALAQRPEELLEAIDHSLYTNVIDDWPTEDTVELARRFFQRSNTTWSHSGAFKTQRRVTQLNRTVATVFEERKRHLHIVAERIRGIIFECLDAVDVIRKYDGPDVLFYVDPPYFGQRKADLYQHEMMDEESHRRLAEALHECQGDVVLSGYSSELYRELYGDWKFNSRLALTNAKQQTSEYLWIKSTLGSVQISHQKAKNLQFGSEIARERLQQYVKSRLHHSNRNDVVPDSPGFDLRHQEKINGFSTSSRQRLNRIERRNPALLEQIATGSLSVVSAYKLCGIGPKQERNDFSGQQFGRWTVSNEHKWVKGGTFWRCQCQCGTIKWIRGSALRRGASRSCSSCSTRIDLSDHQFGRWTVLDKWKRARKLIYWQCQCQCGTIKWVRGDQLRNGVSRSCGCSRRKAVTIAAPTT